MGDVIDIEKAKTIKKLLDDKGDGEDDFSAIVCHYCENELFSFMYVESIGHIVASCQHCSEPAGAVIFFDDADEVCALSEIEPTVESGDLVSLDDSDTEET